MQVENWIGLASAQGPMTFDVRRLLDDHRAATVCSVPPVARDSARGAVTVPQLYERVDTRGLTSTNVWATPAGSISNGRY